MNRRTFVSCLLALPGLRWLKPKATERITICSQEILASSVPALSVEYPEPVLWLPAVPADFSEGYPHGLFIRVPSDG